MLLPPARIFRLGLPLFVLLASTIVARGADAVISPLSTNPRYTGSPVVRTWLAEDYGASPVNTSGLQHPGTGFIYIGNERGVLEFDGAQWRLIPVAEPGIVTEICVDRRGRVWGIGRTGIFRLEPDARGELHTRSLMERVPQEFRVGIGGGGCVATTQGVYFRTARDLIFFPVDDGPVEAWRVAEGAAVTLSLWQIDDVPYVTLSRGVVICHRGGKIEHEPSLSFRVLGVRAGTDGARQLLGSTSVERWDGKKTTTLQNPLGGDAAQSATFLADGRMVFATLNSGLVVCDREGRFLQKIDRAKGLPANNVTAVIEDREGGVWAALRYGIARVQLDSPYARHGPAQGREGSAISLAQRGSELFVAGTENAVRRDADGRFRPVEGASGPDREVLVRGDRVYFLGARLRGLEPTGNRVTQLENRNYYGLVPVTGAPGRFAHGSNEGLRWAHFTGEKWVSEGPLKTLPLGGAFAVLEAPADVIWCTRLNAVVRVDFRAGLRADAPAQSFREADGLPGVTAGMFLLGGEVAAVAGGRLVRFHEAAGRFEPETRVAGLEGFTIERAHRSAGGTIWFQGGPPRREIRRLVPESAGRWRAEKLEGDPLSHVLATALLEDAATQTLWIGGHGALISCDLSWQPTLPALPPSAVVRRVESADGWLLGAGDATPGAFEPAQDALRIAFAAPTFRTDHNGVVRTQYRTRLDGLDREWSAWSKQTERDFTNLAWRSYTFRVQARDDAGRVGPERQFAFSIRPAWWATPWAWVGYAALGVIGFAGAVRLRTRVIHLRTERLEQIVARRTRELADSNTLLATSNAQLAMSNAELARLRQLELDEKITAQLAEEKARLEVLRYQLNPHFLYNALNSIYGLVYENARDAGEMVLRLSEFCRSTLTGAHEELPRLESEIAALRSYLDVEKVRWRDRLQISYEIAPDVEMIPLPPFLLLPLVENAIKHGARTTRERMQITLRAYTIGEPDGTPRDTLPNTVVIEVINSGEWLPPDPFRPGSTGIGLENLRQRLRRYYPDAHSFTTESKDGWVTARVQLSPAGLRSGSPERTRQPVAT